MRWNLWVCSVREASTMADTRTKPRIRRTGSTITRNCVTFWPFSKKTTSKSRNLFTRDSIQSPREARIWKQTWPEVPTKRSLSRKTKPTWGGSDRNKLRHHVDTGWRRGRTRPQPPQSWQWAHRRPPLSWKRSKTWNRSWPILRWNSPNWWLWTKLTPWDLRKPRRRLPLPQKSSRGWETSLKRKAARQRVWGGRQRNSKSWCSPRRNLNEVSHCQQVK